MDVEIRSKYKRFKQEEEILKQKVLTALKYFPELQEQGFITVHILELGNRDKGMAYRNTTDIGLTFGSSMHTIGHELMHLVQHTNQYNLPYSEFACDVWTVARTDVFNNVCPYVKGSEQTFKINPIKHRQFMIKAVKYYKKLGKYKWANKLKKELTQFIEVNKIPDVVTDYHINQQNKPSEVSGNSSHD